jgi:hypothetical protein
VILILAIVILAIVILAVVVGTPGGKGISRPRLCRCRGMTGKPLPPATGRFDQG